MKLWTTITRAIKRRKPRPLTAVEPPPNQASAHPSPLQWDESWNPEIVRLAYEHSREVYRLVDDATEVLNRKVVAVFTVASAIATVGPVLGKFSLLSDGWWLSVGAVAMWLLSTVKCWQAFKPRVYRFDPDPATFLTPEWLSLSLGSFYLHRLESVKESVEGNAAEVTARGEALRDALKCALFEVGFLLAALLWR